MEDLQALLHVEFIGREKFLTAVEAHIGKTQTSLYSAQIVSEAMLWNDAATITEPSSGKIDFTWDVSQLDPPDSFYDIRIQAEDILGERYYSNVVKMNAFGISVTCSGGYWWTAYNYIENVALLQIKLFDPDTKDIKVIGSYDAANGDIPTEEFVPELDLSQANKELQHYLIFMEAKGADEKEYSSSRVQIPPCESCSANVKLFEMGIRYAEALNCNSIAPGQVTLSAKVAEGTPFVGHYFNIIQSGSLTYYIEYPTGERQILKRLELIGANAHISPALLPQKVWVDTTIDISSFADGIYPIEAELVLDRLMETHVYLI